MMGAHPIKVGLSDILIDLIERGFITHMAVNGAFVIHDLEMAFFGRTSEEVADGLIRWHLWNGRRNAETHFSKPLN